MKEILIRMAGVYGTRYLNKQKRDFLTAFGDQFQLLHYDVKVEHDGSKVSSNFLTVGSFKKQQEIFITGYDTGTASVIPSFKYYPFDFKKSQKYKFIDQIVRTLIALVIGLVDLLVINRIPTIVNITWLRVVINVLVIIGFTLLITGIPSRYNMQRNTAAVALLYKAGGELKSNRKFACMFADKTNNNGFIGYRAASNILKGNAKKRVIILDSIALGENYYLLHREKNSETAKQLIKNFEELNIIDYPMSDEKIENTPLAFFPNGFMLVCGQKDKNGDVYCLNTRKSSVDCNLDNLNLLKKGIIRLVNDETFIDDTPDEEVKGNVVNKNPEENTK